MFRKILATAAKIPKYCLLLAIGGYQKLISPLLPNHCRFYPSCSEYARHSLKHYALPTALWRISKRLCKCHPFHPGGYDP